MQVALAASFGYFDGPMKILRGARGARASTRGITRMGTWANGGIATCICKSARVVTRISSLVLVENKASPTSLAPTTLALKTEWPATLAGYPSTAAVAKPLGCRSSSAACIADDVHACLVLIERSVCHVAPTVTRAAL